MAFTRFKIPKKDYNIVAINNSVVAGDSDLSSGELTILNADTSEAFKMKMVDGLGWSKTAFAAGTLSIKTIDFSAVIKLANNAYTMTIGFPNRQDDLEGGRESDAVVKIRTFTVWSTNTVPTTAEIRNLFKTAIDNDTSDRTGVTAGTSGDNLTITMTDVNSGDTVLGVPTGATISVGTPYVAPSGTATIVSDYVSGSAVAAAGEYTTYVLRHRTFSPIALMNGQTMREHKAVLFIEENAAGFGAFETKLDSILDGSYTPVADFLGFPAD